MAAKDAALSRAKGGRPPICLLRGKPKYYKLNALARRPSLGATHGRWGVRGGTSLNGEGVDTWPRREHTKGSAAK